MKRPAHDTEHNTIRPRIVFFGSGPVAAASLELLMEWCDIEAVVTKPRPPHHRGDVPVIGLAKRSGLPLYTAGNRRELDDIVRNTTFSSRAGVLIDFGIIVSQAVIDTFELGIINSHFSLLPEWRGADPITFSILSGQTETGVSLMLLVEAMDEGPILAHTPYALPPDITAPELTAELIELSDHALQSVLPLYLDGAAQPAPQDQVAVAGHQTASYSRKLTKADGILDFSKPATVLEREIRAFAEWPKSRTQLAGKDVVITKARCLQHAAFGGPEPGAPARLELNHGRHSQTGRQPGEAFVLPGKTIAIQTADGILAVDKLKPAGKGEMSAAAFLAGNPL